MYELKIIGENWLLRRIGGRFVRLSILKGATDVQISENCIIADDAIYEIIENNDEILIVAVPEVFMKCDRSQSEASQLRKQKRHFNENQAVECSNLHEKKERKTLTHIVSDETEPDIKETKTKLETLNTSSPKHEASLYLGSDELAEDLKSLATGSDELNEYTQSLEEGSTQEYMEVLDTETSALASKTSVSERYDDAYDMNKQQNTPGDDVSLPLDHTCTFFVDVKPSDLAKACGIYGTVICSIDSRSLTFRDSMTDEVIYSFSFPWMRRYWLKPLQQLFVFEIGRTCPYGSGIIGFSTKYARAINDLITKLTNSKGVVLQLT